MALQGCDQNRSEPYQGRRHQRRGTGRGGSRQASGEKYRLDVELVGFSGSLLPNDATDKGELDANVFQHRPFLEQQNKDHGYKLVAVGNTFVFPMAGYSR
ncbi:MetQ/NlpA family ABC transporter substrate-binding protein [Serratia ureilytica]